MSASETVIAALKFKGGVIIGADSQASDPIAQVRWPLDKLSRVGQHACIIGFSGSVGRAQRAREQLSDAQIVPGAFRKSSTVRNIMDKTFAPIYQEIKERWGNPPSPIWNVALWGLIAYWAEGSPWILEYEISGESSYHDNFHVIGSGSSTAHAVYRTLGGARLCNLEEGKALGAMLRILRTSVDVDVSGVSDPYHVWVISESKARELQQEEINTHLQSVDEWIEDERRRLFGDS